MRNKTIVELFIIALLTALVGGIAAAGLLPAELSAGLLCLVVSAALLGQGLVRDLWSLRGRRGGAEGEGPAMMCMCVESTAGIAGVVAGALLLGVGLGGTITLSTLTWTALTAAVLIVGLVIRDLVIRAKPFGIVHVPDHGSIRVSMRSGPGL